MDIYCPKCGDPCDHDELHYYAQENGSTYERVAKDFRANGCSAVGFTCNPAGNKQRARVSGAMYELMGDDMDGAAAMFEDEF